MLVQFKCKFSAAHRLQNFNGKCQNLHGHNYTVEVEILSPVNRDGMVVEYGEVKAVVEKFDHKAILEHGDPLVDVLAAHGMELVITPLAPTTENLVRVLAESISVAIAAWAGNNESVDRVRVRLTETDNISASYTI